MSEPTTEIYLFFRDGYLIHSHRNRGVFERWLEQAPYQYPPGRCEIARFVPETEIATAEAHGAALAIEQCRRLAEEAIEEILVARELGEPVEWDSPCEALHHFAASLPATPDLAAEVRRIEERERKRLAGRLREHAWVWNEKDPDARTAVFWAADLIEGGAE